MKISRLYPGTVEYVTRRCQSCGYAGPPVTEEEDDYKNKCPVCNQVMWSCFVDCPRGKVVVAGEEKLGKGSGGV